MPEWIETFTKRSQYSASLPNPPPQMRSVVSQISLRACSKRTNSSLAGEGEGEGEGEEVPLLVMTLPSSGFEEWERGPLAEEESSGIIG